MDLDQYREMKAQEVKSQEEGNPNAQTQYTTASSLEEFMEATGAYQETPPAPEQQVETQEVANEIEAGDPNPPNEVAQKITIDGKEYDAESLQKMLADAEQAKQNAQRLYNESESNKLAIDYYNTMMQDPEYAKAFAQDRGLPFLDPKDKAVQELEQKYNAMLLEREIDMMKSQYSDFNAQDVVQFALDRNIPNLQDAYTLMNVKQSNPQSIDTDALREQIKQELLSEMKVDNTDTTSIVGAQGGGAKQVQKPAAQLSALEMRIAQEFGMSASEYAKYK